MNRVGPRIEIRPYRDLSQAALDDWRRLSDLVHPPGEPRLGSDLQWADLDPDTDELIRAWDEDELRACGWTTRRTVKDAGVTIAVGGIRGVMTHPALRRQGYGRRVMLHAQAVLDANPDLEVSLLFSSPIGVPFYESLGWRPIRGPVFCGQPGGRLNYSERIPDGPVMERARVGTATRFVGQVDVLGLPW